MMAATGDVIGLAAMSAIDVCSDGNITNSLMSDLVAYRIIASETAKFQDNSIGNCEISVNRQTAKRSAGRSSRTYLLRLS